MSLWVEPVACLRDNYAYLLGSAGSTQCVVVDPSEAAPVRARLAERGLELVAVLNTHHHPDHTGGNLELAREFALPVYAHVHDRDRIPGLTHTLEDGDHRVVSGLAFSVLHLPGHTQGAVTYLTDGFAFTGDTLFCAGCGRLKEGTAAQLFTSLERLKTELLPQTVCCTGHEYTQANLCFAKSLQPGNTALIERLEHVDEQRKAGLPTAMAPWATELATNPFLCADEPALAQAVGLEAGAPPGEVFARLRAKRDIFQSPA